MAQVTDEQREQMLEMALINDLIIVNSLEQYLVTYKSGTDNTIINYILAEGRF